MTNPNEPPYEFAVIAEARALRGVLERASRAAAIAVDVEANGLFVYRPRLCTVQIAWEEGPRTRVAVVDTLALDPKALAPLFHAEGPIAVLHDLTFDARMLAEHGAPLARVRDTSVAARLLGQKATGLSSVLATELGIVLDKRLQQHDWSRRPLDAAEVMYLSADVGYLLRLDRALADKTAAADIEAEVAEECAYKLRAALAPPRDTRPAYVRIKGAQRLDPMGRASLMRLVAARETAAEAANVPPFKIVTNEILLELARQRPRTPQALGRVPGATSGRAGRHAARWLEAIALGVQDGDIPPEDRAHFAPAPMDRREIARRREIESKISTFRRGEAKQRGVDEQVILPGHCAQELANILASTSHGDPSVEERIAQISGLGEKRIMRYGRALASLLEPTGKQKASALDEDVDKT